MHKTVQALFLLFPLALSACAAPAQTPTPVQASATDTRLPLAPTEPPAPADTPVPAPFPAYWQPAPGLAWQWQIDGESFDTSAEADVYDIDLYADQSVIDALHAKGAKVICYLSVGSWEAWRPDANQFPAEVLGNVYAGWEDEKWLDIRQLDVLAPIMRARLDLCKSNGFDAVEPDNMEVTGNDSGFPITEADESRYALWLAEEAHARGLAIGMKNAAHLLPQLLPYFDFIITEDCYVDGWCEEVRPYVQAGKPVYAAEYTDRDIDFAQACEYFSEAGFDAILKNRDLDAWVEHCP